MSAAAKLAGFALALLAVFGAGLGVGTAVGPLRVDGDGSGRVEQPHDTADMDAQDMEETR